MQKNIVDKLHSSGVTPLMLQLVSYAGVDIGTTELLDIKTEGWILVMKMKLLVSAIVGVTLSQPIFAKDIEMGTIEVLADSSISSSKDKTTELTIEETTKSTDINIGLLYYFQKNVGIGLLLMNGKTDVTSTNSAFGASSKFVDKYTAISPAFGYEISLDETSGISLTGVAVGLFKGDGSSQQDSNPAIKHEISGTAFEVAYKKFLTPSVSLNAGVSKLKLKRKYKDFDVTRESDITDFGAGFSVYFK